MSSLSRNAQIIPQALRYTLSLKGEEQWLPVMQVIEPLEFAML